MVFTNLLLAHVVSLASTPLFSHYDVCVIGGGISGLSSAFRLSNSSSDDSNTLKTIILEANSVIGGRVSSEVVDGFTLNRGFAVFIDEYPEAKEIFQYDNLKLAAFQPGALVKTKKGRGLARVADPLRQPWRLLDAIKSPIGKVWDKFRLVPLLLHVKSKSIADLFQEDETDVYTCLKKKYQFSDKMIEEFFKPFFEGIFFCPLQEQSSRMFHFVFKMFSQGSATLPTGGMQAVADQIHSQVRSNGVEVCIDSPVMSLHKVSDGTFDVVFNDGRMIKSKCIICATDNVAARKILATLPELAWISDLEDPFDRSVGCVYYKLKGEVPVKEAILILNGQGCTESNINNICFPSVVNPSYAPDGYHLCSVAIDGGIMSKYEGQDDQLDQVIRQKLGEYFPDSQNDIESDWELLRIYRINNAQPAQLLGPMPANVHGGRPCNMYREVRLPDGLFLCGDYMNTASLNGALESGELASIAALHHMKAHSRNKIS